MATTPTPTNNKKKIWVALAILVACVIIGLVIWKMIAVHV